MFLPGSTSPAAILFEAMELFEKRSPKADEQIRMIRPELVSAVDTCIDAAGREFESHWQKKLLKAATFGKTFLDLYNPTDFVQMTQTLRVLNAARFYEVGIPLTYDQHVPPVLRTRLTDELGTNHIHRLSSSCVSRCDPSISSQCGSPSSSSSRPRRCSSTGHKPRSRATRGTARTRRTRSVVRSLRS